MTSRIMLERVEGNVGPDLFTTVEDLDLTKATAITVIVRRSNGTDIEKTAIIDDAVAGEIHIEWAAGDLTKGDHELEFRFEFGADVVTLPEGLSYVLRVRERI